MLKEIGIVLGVDYGSKKIGFAVGDTLTGTANPEGVKQVFSFTHSVQVIHNKMTQWQAKALVLGLPLQKNGGTQWMLKEVKKLAHSLQKKCDSPIFFSDERYTTKVARSMCQHQRKNKPVDDWAATLMLQCWLLSHAEHTKAQRQELK